MRKLKSLSVLVFALAVVSQLDASAWATAKVDPTLAPFLKAKNPTQKARVEVVMQPQATESAPRRYDRANVIRYLQRVATASWQNVAKYLAQNHVAPAQVSVVRLYSINASFTADVTAEGLMALAQAPGVSKIYFNRRMENVNPVRKRPSAAHGMTDNLSATPYDYTEIGLDQHIAKYPQLNGSGVFLGHIDTGVDGKHPMLAGKIAKFYDIPSKGLKEPYDSDTHGTHTAGTMVGGDWNGERIGMAPGAKLICAAPLRDYNEMVGGMEFMLNPDGDPNTQDSPRAINNSWNSGGAPDQEIFYRAISAWEAAGILPVFSAGNAGPGAGSITPPHEHPLAFAIGSTGQTGKVSSFSSRGPGSFEGKSTQKPDIMAPGEHIRSSVPGGRFEEMDGTSMATPHVTGITGILFQANPALTPDQVRAILYKSATPMDANGNPGKAGVWNASYGFGKLNVVRAVDLALQTRHAPALSLMEGVFSLLTQPIDRDADEIRSLPEQDVQDLFAFPAELEGRNWMTLEEIQAL